MPSSTPAAAAEARRTVVGHGGLPLAVYEQGPAGAPTVVLVHGFPDDHAMWDPVAERLAVDHHVVTYDVRGVGASGVPTDRSGYRLDALVADLVAVADATSPDAPVHVVGHDWGSIQSWSAVLDPVAQGRIASYTTMSAPGLDQVAAWVERRRRPGPGHRRQLLRQGLRSWYVAGFQTSAATWVWRNVAARRVGEAVQRSEGLAADARWPSPNVADDGAHAIDLYRANAGRSAPARPAPAPTPVPVLLLVGTRDPYVTPALWSGIEDLAPDLVRYEVDGKHWLPRSHPDVVARLVARHVARAEANPR